ncbi:MAG: hypothetical protein LBT50_01800 [Prevotellaceae bacterium]|jgi:hypothetical protein|nr:hypothetical protein [Prevotellaceae bacterium]
MNNIIEKELYALCPDEIRELYHSNLCAIPSIYHCVGTGKLLGEFYGKAICHGLNKSKQFNDNVALTSCLTRTYIVLDDFLKDYYVEASIKIHIKNWLRIIQDKILSLLNCISQKSLLLWNQYLKIYEEAYWYFDKNDLYKSINNKCGLLFLFFDIEEIAIIRESLCTKKSMSDFLFCLQLLDDFQDMEEDMLSPMNHNIFLCQNKTKYHKLISNNRHIIHNQLFEYIKNILLKYSSCDNPIITKYISNSIQWLESKKIDYCSKHKIAFASNIECFEFRAEQILDIIDANYSYDFSEIRAENIHTIV